MISVRTQNTLLHCMTDRFKKVLWMRQTGSEVAHWSDQLRRIMEAARELNPRYPALIARSINDHIRRNKR